MSWLKSRFWWGLFVAALPVWWVFTLIWPPRSGLLWPEWLMAVVLYPVLEEIIFRLGLQGWLLEQSWGQKHWRGFSLANGAASAVFVAAHFLGHAPLWALAVGVPSILFGWCYQRWGLAAAITLHVWYNAGYFTLYPAGG